MTPEIFKFVLSIVGFLFVVMLGIIGFFLKKQVDATESLEKTTKMLEITVSSVQTNQTNFSKECGFHHSVIDKTLNDHSKRINENTEKINEHSEMLASIQPKTRRKNG